MASKVTRKDILDYRALAKQEGRDISHLTEAKIIAQIRILKGGLVSPRPSDVDEILARAKATEQLFLQCRQDVLAALRKALAEFHELDQAASGQPKSRSRSFLIKKAERVIALKRELLATPPSLLNPELQGLLALVDSWAVHAEKVVKGKDPVGEKALLGVSRRLTKALEGSR